MSQLAKIKRAALHLAPNWLSGHECTLLQGGEDYFQDLIQAIECAQKNIYIETYICCPQGEVLAVLTAILQAAQRGVSIWFLVDGYGSAPYLQTLQSLLNHSNIEFAIFRPPHAWWHLRKRFTRQSLRRLHRKLVVIDELHAWVGGINLLDDFLDPNHGTLAHARIDYAVRFEGPLVHSVLFAIERQKLQMAWFNRKVRLQWQRLKHLRQQLKIQLNYQWHVGVPSAQDGVPMMLALRDNMHFRRSIEDAYITAIQQAKEEIWLANAYFFPGKKLRKALVLAAKRGVSVHLLLQGKIEYFWASVATKALYQNLLDHGINLYEYHQSFLHAKVAVIDCKWLTVGSSNLDPFSLFLAREANVMIYHQNLATTLRNQLKLHAEHASSISLGLDHVQRTWYQRLFYQFVFRICRFGLLFSARLGRNQDD